MPSGSTRQDTIVKRSRVGCRRYASRMTTPPPPSQPPPPLRPVPPPPSIPPPRLLDRVTTGPGCWSWQGAHSRDGYGVVTLRTEGRRVFRQVHRLMYELWNGPVPDGLVLDHYACSNRGCVRPDHVRPVTHRENTLRSTRHTLATPAMRCKRGHDLTAELGTRPDGCPKCKACHREWQREYRARRAARA